MKVATAFVEVRPDTRNFGRDLDREVTDKAKKASISLGQVLGAGAFLAGANKAIDASSRLEQAVGGTAAVFGEASQKVEEFAKGAAESAGLSERAARELTSALGGLLKGFGFTGDEAADLSVKLATLGADLAATFGGTPEEAVQALGAALRGETDPLERFGIALNQTLVNQKAVELGLAATTSAVDQNAKAQATLALIYERSADAAGQFARESDTAAGQAAIAAAKTENAAADLGDALLPIYSRLASTVGSVADLFGSLPEPVQTATIALGAIVALAPTVKAGLEAMGGAISAGRRGLTAALDASAIGAYNLVGNLTRVGVGLGATATLVGGAAIAFDAYNRKKQDATRRTLELVGALEAEAEGLEGEVDAVLGSEILKGKLGESLRGAGADVRVFTDAISAQADGLGKLDDAFNDTSTVLLGASDGIRRALDETGLAGSRLGDELIRLADSGDLTTEQISALVGRISAEADAFNNAAREAENKGAADEAAGKSAEEAAGGVDKNTGAIEEQTTALDLAKEALDRWKTGMDAAFGDLTIEEAVDRRAKAFADLAKGIDDRVTNLADARRRLAELKAIPVEDRPEDFARQVEAAQADIQAALDETSLSLEGNSEAALRNRDDLREVVDTIADVIQKHRDEGASLEELQTIRALERQGLVDQLEQLGFNKTEIQRYVEAIDAIPISKATTLTVDTAEAEARIKRLVGIISLIPGSIDAAQAEKFLARESFTDGHALGGTVRDGLFTVGEYGMSELLYKQGSRVDVIAGGQPTPVTQADETSLDLVMEMRESNRLLRALVNQQPASDTGTGLRRQVVEV